MSEPDFSQICRIALEEHGGGLLLDTLQAVCRRSCPDQAEALFRRLVEALQAEMAKGLGPEEAMAAIADAGEPERPAKRPWWRRWLG